MVNLAKPDTPMPMADWHDDDDSSVESDFQEDEDNDGCAVVITIDDMSVASRDFAPQPRTKSKPHHAGSFVSVMSTESSIEIETVPVTPSSARQEGNQNASWTNMMSPPTTASNPNERYITFSTTVQVPDATLRNDGGTTARKGRLQHDSCLNASCSSIKDLLRFGSINEHARIDSIGSSDEDESDDDDDDDDDDECYDDVPRNIMGMHVLRNVMPNNDEDGDEYSYHDESLADDSVVNMILRRNTMDNKEQTLRAGKRMLKHSMRNRVPKVKGVTGDPLLNRFLDSKHEKESPSRSQHAIPSFLPMSGRLELNIHSNDLKFDSIMRKTDSLNHVNKHGQRVVKTMHEHHTTSRRSSLMNTQHKQDPLMERFLLSSKVRTTTQQCQFQHGTTLPTSP